MPYWIGAEPSGIQAPCWTTTFASNDVQKLSLKMETLAAPKNSYINKIFEIK